ncbi:MAG: hypothetical protein R6W95_14645, partial [Desulfosarcina sp.]
RESAASSTPPAGRPGPDAPAEPMNTVTESLALATALILKLDPALVQIVGLSLQVSGTACLAGVALGLWLGAALAVWRFPGQAVVVWVLNTLLALPAVVVGLAVYLLGRGRRPLMNAAG